MKRILLGEIGSAHGIRGEVLLRTFTADPAAIADYGPLGDEAGRNPLTVKIVRVTPKGVIARVSGIDDRTAAEKLRGRKLTVERSKLPEPDENEFYHEDLIGLRAVAADGAAIGVVVAMHNFGAGDLLELRRDSAKATEFVAFTLATVPSIDFARGQLVLVVPVEDEEDETDKALGSGD